jgi:hypothetical protein
MKDLNGTILRNGQQVHPDGKDPLTVARRVVWK